MLPCKSSDRQVHNGAPSDASWSAGPAPTVSAVAANLLLVTTAGQIAHPHRCPAQVSHHLREAATCACSATALEYLQVVEQRLRANSLEPIVADTSAHTLQAHFPRIDGRRKFGLRLAQPFNPRLHGTLA